MRAVANGPKYRDDRARSQFYREIVNRARELPGVKSCGVISALPLTGEVGWGIIEVEGFTPEPGQELQADLRVADPDYFSTMEIPLIQGRYFSDHDTPESQQVVIVDENFAQRFWPHENPIGKHVWFDPKKQYVIAGVVGNVKQYGLDSDSKIVAYFPESQSGEGGLYVVARTASDPSGAANPIVAQIHAVDPNVAAATVCGDGAISVPVKTETCDQRISSGSNTW